MIDKSFVDGRDNDLEPLNDSDLFKKGATSLRMSEIGYQGKAQKNLNIKYNDLDEFLDEVKSAITTPYPEFENLGLKDSEGEFHQISSGILQIENELYDCIRPKRAGSSGERPYELLKKEGIKYLEVRGIDLDPEDLAGISKDKILLLDLIMLYCAIKPSSLMSDEEKSVIESNDIATIKSGRLPETIISYKDQPTTIAESRIDVIKDLMQIAAAMNDPKYIEVVSSINTKVNIFNPDKSFHNLGLEKARENSLVLKSNMEIDTHKFKEEAEASLLKFKKIQATANFDKIDEFMNSYNTKI